MTSSGSSAGADPSIRPYRPSDLAELRLICLRTGAAGTDATSLVGDPRLLGDVYVAPYVVFEPECALVLDGGEGVPIGYVVAALDTLTFAARLEADWWPALRRRHPLGSATTSLDEELLAAIHAPPAADPGIVARFPSHVHINLMPVAHGGGWGRRLMEAAVELLAERGSRGVHLGVDPANDRAAGFYDRLGFERLDAPAGGLWFGRSLA